METKKTKNNDNKDNERKDIENSSINNSKYTFDSSDVKEIMTGVGGEGSAYPDSDKYIVEDLKKTIKKEETGVDEENDARNDSEQSSKDTIRWSISYINSWLIWTWKKNKILHNNWRNENSLRVYKRYMTVLQEDNFLYYIFTIVNNYSYIYHL